jgi:hypothetical protein
MGPEVEVRNGYSHTLANVDNAKPELAAGLLRNSHLRNGLSRVAELAVLENLRELADILNVSKPHN